MSFLLALFSVRRHSVLLSGFWLPQVLTYVIILMTREQRWVPGHEVIPGDFALVESLFWFVVLFGVVIWLGRFLWKIRHDWLLSFFTLLPIITLVFNISNNLLSGVFNIAPRLFYWKILGIIGIGNLIAILSLAGIFLLQKRILRWMAFLAGVLALSIQNSYAYWPNPPIVAMWMCLPILLALIAWFDWRAHQVAIFPTTTPTTPAR